MAKVFATYIENDTVTLKTWPNMKSFNKNESWLDEKFILIATSDDFKGKKSFPLSPMYDEKETFIEPKGNGITFALNKNEIEAHNLLFEARNEYLGIKEIK